MNIKQHIVTIPSYDPFRHLHFQQLSKDTDTNDMNLYMGRQGDIDVQTGKINIFLDTQQPNMWFHWDSLHNAILNQKRYHKILSICPYTSQWRNKVLNDNKYIFVPHFLNVKYLPNNFLKTHDLIYTGHHSPLLPIIGNIISMFNSNLICNNPGISYSDKLSAIANSKITIVHNLIHIDDRCKNVIRSIEGFQNNYIFKKLQDKSFLPQIKTRVFQAAFCKSLILCLPDQYNVIQKFFKPNVDFLYLDGDPKVFIKNILDNYESYDVIIKNAYEKAMNLYTTKNIVGIVRGIKCSG